jgi:hypothetical protein
MKPKLACVLLAMAVLVAAAGCASTNVSTIPYPNVPAFPQTDPAKVQILRAEPARPHVKLGEVTVDVSSSPPPSAQEIDGLLRLAAARLGADAVVIVDDPTAPGAQVASRGWWGRTPVRAASRELIAVAVRYR